MGEFWGILKPTIIWGENATRDHLGRPLAHSSDSECFRTFPPVLEFGDDKGKILFRLFILVGGDRHTVRLLSSWRTQREISNKEIQKKKHWLWLLGGACLRPQKTGTRRVHKPPRLNARLKVKAIVSAKGQTRFFLVI